MSSPTKQGPIAAPRKKIIFRQDVTQIREESTKKIQLNYLEIQYHQ